MNKIIERYPIFDVESGGYILHADGQIVSFPSKSYAASFARIVAERSGTNRQNLEVHCRQTKRAFYQVFTSIGWRERVRPLEIVW